MIVLIGQYDSGFVRRVAVALSLYDIPFEHWPWSVFGDVDRLKAYNPLVRVPTLVLDNGDVLVDSHAIIDYLDHVAGPARALLPQAEPLRHQALKIVTLATGILDKGVSRFYEQYLHAKVSDNLMARLEMQIKGALNSLEHDRASRRTTYWFGETMTHADIAVTCMMRHMGDAQADIFKGNPYPALAKHAAHMEAMPLFKSISQPFIAPV
jgi:glutathione S-transferase